MILEQIAMVRIRNNNNTKTGLYSTTSILLRFIAKIAKTCSQIHGRELCFMRLEL